LSLYSKSTAVDSRFCLDKTPLPNRTGCCVKLSFSAFTFIYPGLACHVKYHESHTRQPTVITAYRVFGSDISLMYEVLNAN
jgi:hypothetical protein